MGALDPIAFDIETSGLEPGAAITVAGFATDMGAWLALNTTGRDADAVRLETDVEHKSGTNVRISTHPDESSLLTALGDFARERIDGNRHYLTAYHGETWKGGFDLQFLRRTCVRRGVEWPFPDVAYADVMTVCERFNTGDVNDLVGVYDELIGGDHKQIARAKPSVIPVKPVYPGDEFSSRKNRCHRGCRLDDQRGVRCRYGSRQGGVRQQS